MKKIALLFLSLTIMCHVYAQTVITKDFNDYKEGVLNGQDNWVARAHSAGGGQLKIDYLGDGLPTTPDETLGVFFSNANTNYGEVATHKSTPDFQFDFSEGGTIEIEIDMYYDWWGSVFGVGFDADGDGVVLPPMNYEPTVPNTNLPSKDGGVYFTTSGKSSTDPKFKNGIVLPDNTMPVEFDYDASVGWTRWKIMIDLEANNKAGSVTLFADHGCLGEFQPIPEIQGINAGLTPGSGDCKDPAMWDGIFFLNSSKAGYDNLLVRHIPAGLSSQFIDFENISDQLISAAPITLKATATSGLPVTFELLEGPATLDGNVLTLNGAGVVKVRASQEGNDEWQAAPSVTRTFEVIDPEDFTPEITIRRPYDGTFVYVNDLESPVILVLSAYIEHGDAIKFESVTCDIDGETVELMTAYPDDPENGYWYAQWTPSKYGVHNMTATIEQSGGKVTSVSNSFEVTNTFDNISVTAFDGDLVVSPQKQNAFNDYIFPTHVNAFNNIKLNYSHNCAGNCDPYDRVGYCRIKNYRGEWVELYRYVTPFGVECDDDLDVTDFTSLLQGLVEFELYFQTWDGQGYNPTAIFDYTKGTPEYKYVDMNEIWYGIFDFGDYANKQPVPERIYYFEENVEKANLKIITTGHNWSSGTNDAYNTGNAAEFYEATHNIFVDDKKTFNQHLWQNCNPNPAGCQPQNGTWTYQRSGWCPGSLATVWDFELNDYIANDSIKLFYQFDPEYIDECHPNHPDCKDGLTCKKCSAADNPILRVSGKIVSYSNNINVLNGGKVDLQENMMDYNVEMFPNPANDVLRLTTDYDKGKVCVHILNMQGQEVRNFVFEGTTTIDISDLAPGMYFVNVIGGHVTTQKLVVR